MLNNGDHYVIEFSEGIASSLGLAKTVWGVWPSRIGEFLGRSRLLILCQKAHRVNVAGLKLRSIEAIKDRSPGTRFDIDIAEIDSLPEEALERIMSTSGRIVN
jgi:hypothetical protein